MPNRGNKTPRARNRRCTALRTSNWSLLTNRAGRLSDFSFTPHEYEALVCDDRRMGQKSSSQSTCENVSCFSLRSLAPVADARRHPSAPSVFPTPAPSHHPSQRPSPPPSAQLELRSAAKAPPSPSPSLQHECAAAGGRRCCCGAGGFGAPHQRPPLMVRESGPHSGMARCWS